jgi:hypothetical protein
MAKTFYQELSEDRNYLDRLDNLEKRILSTWILLIGIWLIL